MSTSKKIFFISLALFCIALLFFGIYNLAFKKPTVVTPAVVEQKAPAVITPQVPPKISTDPIAAISDEAVLAPTLASGSNAIKYYSKNNGKVYQIDFDGNSKRTLSDKELIGLSDVTWSFDKNKIITKFVSAGATKFYYYNYTELKNTPLDKNFAEVAWQNTGNRIFYKYSNPTTKKSTLNVSDPDGTNWKKLADLNFPVSIAQIPQSGLVSFWNKPDAFFETNLKSIPLIGGEEKILLKGLFGADYLWNGNGTAALVSHSDVKGGTKIQLATINSNGGEFRDLNLPTLTSKCVWSKDNKTAYCAMPGEVPVSAIMPNDYDQGKIHTADTFWKIDTTTGEKNRIIDLAKITSKYDATDLFLDANESILFFTNRVDGKLYRITL